jgi:hypothetical protein
MLRSLRHCRCCWTGGRAQRRRPRLLFLDHFCFALPYVWVIHMKSGANRPTAQQSNRPLWSCWRCCARISMVASFICTYHKADRLLTRIRTIGTPSWCWWTQAVLWIKSTNDFLSSSCVMSSRGIFSALGQLLDNSWTTSVNTYKTSKHTVNVKY